MLWHIRNAELLAEGYTDEFKILRYLITIILYISIAWAIFAFDDKIALFCDRIFRQVIPKAKVAAITSFFFIFLKLAAAFAQFSIWDILRPKYGKLPKSIFIPKVLKITGLLSLIATFQLIRKYPFPRVKTISFAFWLNL